MKKKYYLMALAGLLMASCNEDNDPLNNTGGGEGTIGAREISFVFPGTAQGVVPYAVTALPEENELKTLDIYVFGEDSMKTAKPMVLEEIFRSGQGYDLTENGPAKQAKISLPSGNNKAVFFVANGREHLSLDSVELHVTDTATFKAKISNTLKGHIACPMLMSSQLDMPNVAATVAAATAAKKGVEVVLTRRVARFDIKNNSETSNFTIDKVVIKKVPANVPLFPKSYTAPTVAEMPLIDFSAMKNSNVGVTNSVFYMYPIKMKTGEEVELSLAGTNLVTNVPQILDVVFKNYKDKNTINVEANNRYLIEVEDLGSGELEAKLKVLDWIVGDTVNVNTGDGTIKLSSADGRFGNSILKLGAEPTLATDSVLIAVAADSEWELIVEDQYKDWIGVSALPGNTVMKEFKVTTLLPNPSSKEERQGVVMVQNVRRPSIRQPLVIKQAANTTRYLDLSGKAIAGNLLAFSGETASDSLNVKIAAPTGRTWIATKSATASWFTFGNEATGLKAAATDGSSFEGTGEATFSIVPTANMDKDKARVDTITITLSKDGAETIDLVQKLIVRQAPQNLGTIMVKCIGLSADGKVGIPANGFTDKGTNGEHKGERLITVNATTAWKVVIPENVDWLTQVGGSINLVPGSQNGSFYLNATANTATSAVERTAIVKIQNAKDDKIYKEITFTQAADPQDILTLAASSLSWTNSEANAKTIDVTAASANWSLDKVPAWLTATASTGGVDEDIELTPNTSGVTVPFFADKTATIDVKAGNATKQITVTWNAETVTFNAITAPTTIAATGTAGTAVEVAVTCNDGENWTVSKEDSVDWLTVKKNGANVEVEAAEFIGGNADRTATVTITSDSQSGVTTTFTVTQAYQ